MRYCAYILLRRSLDETTAALRRACAPERNRKERLRSTRSPRRHRAWREKGSAFRASGIRAAGGRQQRCMPGNRPEPRPASKKLLGPAIFHRFICTNHSYAVSSCSPWENRPQARFRRPHRRFFAFLPIFCLLLSTQRLRVVLLIRLSPQCMWKARHMQAVYRRVSICNAICLFRPREVGYAGFLNSTQVADEQTGTH